MALPHTPPTLSLTSLPIGFSVLVDEFIEHYVKWNGVDSDPIATAHWALAPSVRARLMTDKTGLRLQLGCNGALPAHFRAITCGAR